MIDRIARDDLRTEAIAFALEMSGRKHRLSEENVPPDEPDALAAAVAAAGQLGRRNSAVVEAVAAVQMAGTVPFGDGVGRERAIFQRLRQGEESAALRYLFFAERTALRAPKGPAASIATVGVVGLGLMGSGIAASLACCRPQGSRRGSRRRIGPRGRGAHSEGGRAARRQRQDREGGRRGRA